MKTIKRTGLGFAAFAELRYHNPVEVAKMGAEIAKEIDDFVLNKPQYRDSAILVAGQNFGCGSSREHAPWSISGFGIRCIIAPSFADIFYNNCFKNGMLPVVLPAPQVREALPSACSSPCLPFGRSPRLRYLSTQCTSKSLTIAFILSGFRAYG